ncbi:MAG: SCO family protein, partial [Bryobacteraceae bacterium]
MQKSKLASTLCLLVSAGAVYAQSPYGRPAVLQNVGIDQKLNAQIPMDLKFTDETGQTVQLAQYFGQRPVVLALVYYTCPMLCDLILDGTVSGLKHVTSLSAGKDFNVLAVSFDPRDTPQTAAAKKKKYVELY